MHKGPKGQKRPADVIGNAVLVAQMATDKDEDEFEGDGQDPAAKTLGKRGGEAGAAKLTPEHRREIAKKAAQKRWE